MISGLDPSGFDFGLGTDGVPTPTGGSTAQTLLDHVSMDGTGGVKIKMEKESVDATTQGVSNISLQDPSPEAGVQFLVDEKSQRKKKSQSHLKRNLPWVALMGHKRLIQKM